MSSTPEVDKSMELSALIEQAFNIKQSLKALKEEEETLVKRIKGEMSRRHWTRYLTSMLVASLIPVEAPHRLNLDKVREILTAKQLKQCTEVGEPSVRLSIDVRKDMVHAAS